MGLSNVALGSACPDSLAAAFAHGDAPLRKIHDALEIVRVLLATSSCFITLSRLVDAKEDSPRALQLAVVKSYTKARMDGMALRQVELEINLHQQLQHNEHVVPFWLAAEDASQLHIVMQHCSEGDLHQKMLATSSLAEAAVRDQVARPLLAALQDMHGRGFVHRDLKPENCFIWNNKLLLGDFGLAVQCSDSPSSDTQPCMQLDSGISSPGAPTCKRRSRTSHDSNSSGGSDGTCEQSSGSNDGSGRGRLQQWHSMSSMATSPSSTPRQQAGGTPAYTAPEVVAAAFNNTSPAAALGPQNDVWSLGVLVLECLCGHHPFLDDCAHPSAVMCEIASSKQLQLGQLPVSLACRDWLTAALAADPGHRATAQQLLHHPWMAAELPAAAPWQPAAHQQQQHVLLGDGQHYTKQQLRAMLSQRSCPDQLLGCTAGDEGFGFGYGLQEQQQCVMPCRRDVEAARMWDAGCMQQLPGIRSRALPRAPSHPQLSGGGSSTEAAAGEDEGAVVAGRGGGGSGLAGGVPGCSSSSACGARQAAADDVAVAAAAGLQRNAMSCMGQAAVGAAGPAAGPRVDADEQLHQEQLQQPARTTPVSFLGGIGSWED